LIKKAAVKEVLDFTDFIESRIESVFLTERRAEAFAIGWKTNEKEALLIYGKLIFLVYFSFNK
jgi:hypothetical protein